MTKTLKELKTECDRLGIVNYGTKAIIQARIEAELERLKTEEAFFEELDAGELEQEEQEELESVLIDLDDLDECEDGEENEENDSSEEYESTSSNDPIDFYRKSRNLYQVLVEPCAKA
jgi:hypothetical protein